MRAAWASPGQGVTRTLIAGPVLLDEIDIKTETDTHEAEIRTKGPTDAYVQINRVAPGGYSGWHSHPGPVFVLVKTGIATRYDAADPTRTPMIYPTGTVFVEGGANDRHNLRNEQDTDLEVIVVFLVPSGGPTRIEEPQPPSYPF